MVAQESDYNITFKYYRTIDKSTVDTKEAIRTKDEDPEFFEAHKERLQWAIEEVEKINPKTACQLQKQLLQKHTRLIQDLTQMEAVQ